MIRVLCVNPVIDRFYDIDGFEPGKKYFNLKRKAVSGGKGINVAKVCCQFRESVKVYGYVGGNNGRKIRNDVWKAGMESCLIEIDGDTRETINIIDHQNHLESELVESGPFVQPRQIEELLWELQKDMRPQDIVVCSGMMIQGAPDDLYRQISWMCRREGALCCLDTNSVSIGLLSQAGYFFYKPNLTELFELFRMEVSLNQEKIASLALKLVEMGIPYVIVSLGADGAILASKDVCFRAYVPEVEMTSTIGCGDCVVAGFAIGIHRKWNIEEVFRFSMACGTANAAEGSVGQINPSHVEKLKNQVRIQEILANRAERRQFGKVRGEYVKTG